MNFHFTQINWDLTETDLEHQSASVLELLHRIGLIYEDFHITLYWKNSSTSGENNC